MPNEAEDLKVGDIVVTDWVTFGPPSFGLVRNKHYRIKRIDPDQDGRDYIVSIENLDGSRVDLKYQTGDTLSACWLYKVSVPSNKERIEQRRALLNT